MTRVALVSCAASKADRPCPARDLYTSALFRLSAAWAQRNADRWYILSAEHALVSPDRVLAPYDTTLKTMTPALRRAWAARVARDLARVVGGETTLVALAGEAYMGWTALVHNPVERPLDGLQIGYRLQWLKRELERDPHVT